MNLVTVSFVFIGNCLIFNNFPVSKLEEPSFDVIVFSILFKPTESVTSYKLFVK